MNDSQRAMIRGRGHFLLGSFLLAMVLIGVESFDLQVLEHEELSKKYQSSHKALTVPAKRGNIFDRNGQKLALSVDVPSIYANPMKIQDPRPVAKALSKVNLLI